MSMAATLVTVFMAGPRGNSRETGANTSSSDESNAAVTAERGWIRQIQAGEESAFEILFRTYFEPLTRYAATYVTDDLATREIVSEVFAALWEHRSTWEPRCGMAAYLYGAVRNRALNYERSRRRRAAWSARASEEPEPPGMGLPRDADDEERYRTISQHVREAIDVLPPMRREAMTLRWYHQMTPEQIAEVMGISRTAVYHLLGRSLETLRTMFEDED